MARALQRRCDQSQQCRFVSDADSCGDFGFPGTVKHVSSRQSRRKQRPPNNLVPVKTNPRFDQEVRYWRPAVLNVRAGFGVRSSRGHRAEKNGIKCARGWRWRYCWWAKTSRVRSHRPASIKRRNRSSLHKLVIGDVLQIGSKNQIVTPELLPRDVEV